MNSPSVNQHQHPHQNEPAWSKSEKAIAHKAFDAALERELQEVIQKKSRRPARSRKPPDLWDLEHYLTQRRKEIDRKYDHGYSQLDLVFGRLLREKWINEEDLRGLGRTRCEPSVLTPSSSLERTQHDLVLSAIACGC